MVAVLISSLLLCLSPLALADAAPAKCLPDFVREYAPLSHLHTTEKYWPSNVGPYLTGVIPEVNFKPVGGTPTLQNVSTLANNVSLTATGDVLAHNTEFFTSTSGKPTSSGASAAPGTIIAVEKPGGIVDAFYFYFYSWNEGNT